MLYIYGVSKFQIKLTDSICSVHPKTPKVKIGVFRSPDREFGLSDLGSEKKVVPHKIWSRNKKNFFQNGHF